MYSCCLAYHALVLNDLEPEQDYSDLALHITRLYLFYGEFKETCYKLKINQIFKTSQREFMLIT